jgi:hypothetical protein
MTYLLLEETVLYQRLAIENKPNEEKFIPSPVINLDVDAVTGTEGFKTLRISLKLPKYKGYITLIQACRPALR